MPKSILLLNGPNLNMLGTREPGLYGSVTLADLEAGAIAHGQSLGLSVTARQSNYEGQLVEWIQEASAEMDGIVINPAAYSHTSIAIHDALKMFEGPVVEVHISQIHKREAFRHHSYVSAVADAIIIGAGVQGYELALTHIAQLLAD